MGTMPQLDASFYFSQVFWFFVSFSLLYFMISSFILPRIEHILRLRFKAVERSVSNTQSFCKLTEIELQNQYNVLERARIDGQEIIQKALEESLKMRDHMKSLINDELSEMFKLSQKYIEELRIQSREDLINASVDISKIYYRKLVGCDVCDHDRLKDIVSTLFGEIA